MSASQAWIGYDNFWNRLRNSIQASSTYAGTYPQNAGSWALFEKYAPANMNEHWLLLDCLVETSSNYFGMAGHNLGVAAGRLVYEGSHDGITWTTILDYSGAVPPLYGAEYSYDGEITYSEQYEQSIITNKVLGWAYGVVTYRYYRLRFWASAGIPNIGLVLSGMRMDFPIGFYGGFTPADWNDEAEAVSTRSDKGLFLGRSIARYGLRAFPIELSPVTHNWVDTVWMPFKRHAQKYPFLFAWGDTPDSNRAYSWVKSFMPSSLKNIKHATVGVTCEGVSE